MRSSGKEAVVGAGVHLSPVRYPPTPGHSGGTEHPGKGSHGACGDRDGPRRPMRTAVTGVARIL